MNKPKWEINVPDLKVDRKNYIIDGRKFVRVTRSLDIISKPGAS